MKNATGIDDYIAQFPDSVQTLMQQLRLTIQQAAPEAGETISYGIPTFTLKGNLVHFGAFKNHIGFYPAPSGIEAFREELSVYESSKGAIKFPVNKPIPYKLIGKIVKFRVKENVAKALTKTGSQHKK